MPFRKKTSCGGKIRDGEGRVDADLVVFVESGQACSVGSPCHAGHAGRRPAAKKGEMGKVGLLSGSACENAESAFA